MAKKKSTSKLKYTDPDLRDHLKARIQEGDKGGKPGQWSARKSQLLASAYKHQGGGYVGGKGASQKSLDKWTQEDWQTQDGQGKARDEKTTHRYLPKAAWEDMSEASKQATETRKVVGSRAGKQYIGNTPSAKKARKKASKKVAKKATRKAASAGKKTKTRPKKKTAVKKQ